jgi:acetone carboxylase gamma subunit
MAAKDCPMCGESMRLHEGETTERVAGTAQTRTTRLREWVCPECDYFEEVDDDVT